MTLRRPGAASAAVLSAGALDASAYGPAEAISKKPPPKAPKAEEGKKADDFVKLENGLAYQNKKVNTGALANVEMKVWASAHRHVSKPPNRTWWTVDCKP